MYYFTEQNIFIFLLQLFLLLGSARVLGEIFRKFKQPAITAEILVGVFFGPTVFGRFLPQLRQLVFPQDPLQQNMLETFAWLGLLFFLLETGLKMDFSSAWRHRGKALTIALTDIIVPFSLAFFSCLLLPEKYLLYADKRFLFASFMATVMTISAMPTTVRALNDLGLIKTDLGYLIMSALSVNEVIGWAVFTVILGFVANVNVDAGSVMSVFLVTVAFTAFCLSGGRRLANYVISWIRRQNTPEPGTSLTFICLLGIFCGAIFQKMGINALLGFFIAGIMAGEAKALPERTRQVISQMVYAIFVPLFFTGIGLKVDFAAHFDVLLVFFITFLSISGKFLGAWLGVTFTSLPRSNRLAVSVAHTPGGSMEIVIAILALQYKLINEPVFVAIVFAGVLSAVFLGPWLKYSLCRRKEISVLEFFSHRQVIADLKSTTREDAVEELCLLAADQDNMPSSESLARAVLRRENLMGTALEEGLALPHARVAHLMRSVIVFGRSSAGIEWNSPDGKLSSLFFLVLTPKEDDEAQLQILRIIATVMSNAHARGELLKAHDSHELWRVLRSAFTPHNVVRKK